MVIAVCVRSPEPSCQEGTGEGTARKKAKPSHPDNSWTHRPHTESAPPPLHLHEHPMSHKCVTCTWISTFTLLRKPADSVIYITICLKGPYLRTCVNAECLLKNQSSPTVQSSSTRPTGDDAMSVKQGFFLLNSKTCLFVQVKPASLVAVKFI